MSGFYFYFRVLHYWAKTSGSSFLTERFFEELFLKTAVLLYSFLGRDHESPVVLHAELTPVHDEQVVIIL